MAEAVKNSETPELFDASRFVLDVFSMQSNATNLQDYIAKYLDSSSPEGQTNLDAIRAILAGFTEIFESGGSMEIRQLAMLRQLLEMKGVSAFPKEPSEENRKLLEEAWLELKSILIHVGGVSGTELIEDLDLEQITFSKEQCAALYPDSEVFKEATTVAGTIQNIGSQVLAASAPGPAPSAPTPTTGAPTGAPTAAPTAPSAPSPTGSGPQTGPAAGPRLSPLSMSDFQSNMERIMGLTSGDQFDELERLVTQMPAGNADALFENINSLSFARSFPQQKHKDMVLGVMGYNTAPDHDDFKNRFRDILDIVGPLFSKYDGVTSLGGANVKRFLLGILNSVLLIVENKHFKIFDSTPKNFRLECLFTDDFSQYDEFFGRARATTSTAPPPPPPGGTAPAAGPTLSPLSRNEFQTNIERILTLPSGARAAEFETLLESIPGGNIQSLFADLIISDADMPNARANPTDERREQILALLGYGSRPPFKDLFIRGSQYLALLTPLLGRTGLSTEVLANVDALGQVVGASMELLLDDASLPTFVKATDLSGAIPILANTGPDQYNHFFEIEVRTAVTRDEFRAEMTRIMGLNSAQQARELNNFLRHVESGNLRTLFPTLLGAAPDFASERSTPTSVCRAELLDFAGFDALPSHTDFFKRMAHFVNTIDKLTGVTAANPSLSWVQEVQDFRTSLNVATYLLLSDADFSSLSGYDDTTEMIAAFRKASREQYNHYFEVGETPAEKAARLAAEAAARVEAARVAELGTLREGIHAVMSIGGSKVTNYIGNIRSRFSTTSPADIQRILQPLYEVDLSDSNAARNGANDRVRNCILGLLGYESLPSSEDAFRRIRDLSYRLQLACKNNLSPAAAELNQALKIALFLIAPAELWSRFTPEKMNPASHDPAARRTKPPTERWYQVGRKVARPVANALAAASDRLIVGDRRFNWVLEELKRTNGPDKGAQYEKFMTATSPTPAPTSTGPSPTP